MYRKKLLRACLTGVMVVSIATANVAPVIAAEPTTETQEQTEKAEKVRVQVNFVNEDGQAVLGKWVELTEGTHNYSELKEHLPEGYEMTSSGDFYAEEKGNVTVGVKKIVQEAEKVRVQVDFVNEDGQAVLGKWVELTEGVHNYSELKEHLPEGYEMTSSGDFYAKEKGNVTVGVKKIVKESIVKIQFVDADTDEVVAGGDYFVDADGDGIFNHEEVLEWVPEGYELQKFGDFQVSDYKETPLQLTVKKIAEDPEIPLTPLEPSTPVEKPENPETPDKGDTNKEDSKKEETKKEDKKKNSPKTGDETNAAAAALPVGASLAAILAVLVKKFR